MKDVKFRAWDKERKYFIANSGVFINGIGSIYVQDMHYGTINKIDDDSIDIMLYTGMQDSNGKYIYEGDIVKRSDSKTNFIIVFNKGCFCTQDSENLHHNLGLLDSINSFSKVIGNIYENPELLS
jgi:uncharacterized phage protein (TIGR01671 family)